MSTANNSSTPTVQAPKHVPHTEILADAQESLARFRELLMIPPHWQVKLEIGCPEDLSEEGNVVGRMRWGYLPNNCYQMQVRCDVPKEARDWTIAHELLEAMLGAYGDFTEKFIDHVRSKALREHFYEEHGDIRDHHIEWILRVILRMERPFIIA